MVTLDNSTEYDNYLNLRRQLGDQENGDLTRSQWDTATENSKRTHIHKMLEKVDDLMRHRDFSWLSYIKNQPQEEPGRWAYKSAAEWDAAPLFIKAAIIPAKLFSARMREKDKPESD